MELDAAPAEIESPEARDEAQDATSYVRCYRMQTERLKALDAFVTPYGPWSSAGPLQDGAEEDADIRAARGVAVMAAFEAIRRIADAS